MSGPPPDRRPVAVVTGGGGGIGAAIAEALGRAGAHVVTVDPLVSLDGAEVLPPAQETTAGRIVAAGGSAQASSVSVTDGDGVRALFAELVEQHGGLDAVVNGAGITRPTGFAKGDEEDWLAVLGVHLDGYVNVLAAALPRMAAAGHGRILGVTSGSGWRAADAGAYSCAKRAVAALTWELGRVAPDGVAVNALSPIAVTRMVTAALGRAPAAAASGGSAATGGLSLGSMPTPDQLGPLGAHLVDGGFAACAGQVVFAGGAEVAVVDPPRLLEVVRTHGVASLPHLLEAATAGALVPAESAQASAGGGNPRFGSAFADDGEDLPTPVAERCAVVSTRAEVSDAVVAALAARGVTATPLPAAAVAGGVDFASARAALDAFADHHGPLDGIVVALDGAPAASPTAPAWERVLHEHAGLVGRLHADAAWARAVADHAAAAGRPVRLVTLTDATTAGGRSRAQAAAQLARASRRATDDRVAAFSVGVEAAGEERVVGELAAHLLCSPVAVDLAGAELAVGPGWIGLRSHPRPGGSISFGGPELPEWFDAALAAIAGTPGSAR